MNNLVVLEHVTEGELHSRLTTLDLQIEVYCEVLALRDIELYIDLTNFQR